MNKKTPLRLAAVTLLTAIAFGVGVTSASADSPESEVTRKTPMDTSNALLNMDFEGKLWSGAETGIYTGKDANVDFNKSRGIVSAAQFLPVDSVTKGWSTQSSNHYLRKEFTQGTWGAPSGPEKSRFLIDWMAPKTSAGLPYSSMWFAERVKFSNGFDFNKGGKMPGLCGGTCSRGGGDVTDAPDDEGVNSPDGHAIGWSARNMWRKDGKIVQYLYTAGNTGTWGVDYVYKHADGTPVQITDDKWHTIEHYVLMNTPGQNNGKFIAWFDGEEVLRITDMRFRDDLSFGVDQLHATSAFGGNDSSWAPRNDSVIFFDDFVVATHRITSVGTTS